MISIQEFKVFPSYNKSRAFDASWRVGSTDADMPIEDLRFRLDIAERESGPWLQVGEILQGVSQAYGLAPELWSNTPGRFLRLVVLSPIGTEVANSGPFTHGPSMSKKDFLEYRDQLRRENLALEKMTGIAGWVFPRISTGCPCPDCADEILGGAPDSSCPTCFGTGTRQGYLPPTKMMIDWSTKVVGTGNRGIGPQGPEEVDIKRVKVLPYPSVAAMDVIVDDATRIAYEVRKIDPVVYKVWPTASVLTVVMLSKKDPANNLQIPA